MIISMPYLTDGHYWAHAIIHAASMGLSAETLLASTSTHFWIDAAGGCLSIDSLPSPEPHIGTIFDSSFQVDAQRMHIHKSTTDNFGEESPKSARAYWTGDGGGLINLAEGQPAHLSSRLSLHKDHRARYMTYGFATPTSVGSTDAALE